MVILIDGIFVGNKKKWNKTSFSSSFDLALLVTKNPFMLQSSSNFLFFLWFGFILPAAMNQCKNEHEVEYPRILTEKRRTIECCSNNMIDSMFYMKFWKLTHSLCIENGIESKNWLKMIFIFLIQFDFETLSNFFVLFYTGWSTKYGQNH